MKSRHVLIFVALSVTIWLAFFAEGPSDKSIVDAKIKNVAANERASRPSGKSEKKVEPLLDLHDRKSLIEVDQKTKEVSLFGQQSWVPQPVVAVATKPLAPPAPVLPPLPFQYIGKKWEDGNYEVFLANGDKTYAVSVNTVIENTYRVDAIKPPLMHLTYLPLNQAQTLSIGHSE